MLRFYWRYTVFFFMKEKILQGLVGSRCAACCASCASQISPAGLSRPDFLVKPAQQAGPVRLLAPAYCHTRQAACEAGRSRCLLSQEKYVDQTAPHLGAEASAQPGGLRCIISLCAMHYSL
jgi:hypothetical protein